MTSQGQKTFYFTVGSEVYVLIFFRKLFMYARQIQVQKKVHFESLQFLVKTFNMGFYAVPQVKAMSKR